MKIVLQDLKKGVTTIAEVPRPAVSTGELLIATSRSVISAGTERMLVDFGKAGWFAKARQKPDKVRQVLDKVRTDGLGSTIETVREKLDQPLAMGYCNAGTVLELGCKVDGFSVGDRVVSNGHHAEVVAVPARLCARIPDGIGDDAAAVHGARRDRAARDSLSRAHARRVRGHHRTSVSSVSSPCSY